MRTGVFGGTFDPVHYGHLLLAETARERLALDRVLFVPAGIPPHKRTRKITSGEDRAEMLQRALRDIPEFELCRYEIDSPEVSFTYKTLRHLRELFPRDLFFLIVGSETLADIPNWRFPDEVCRLASIAAARRPGAPIEDFSGFSPYVNEERIAEFRRQILPMPLIELSSTAIRQRTAEGRSIRFLTPETVVAYIRENVLYSPAKSD